MDVLLIGGAATLVFLLISLAWGLLRGLSKVRIRFFCILLCTVLAFVVTMTLKNRIPELFEQNSEMIQTALEEAGQTDLWELIDGSESLKTTLLGMSGALTAPIIFLLLFLALQLVTWIVYFIVTLILHRTLRRADKNSRLKFVRILAYVLIQFLLILFVFLTPIACYLEFAPEAVNAVKESEVLDAQTTETVESLNVEKANKGSLVSIYRALGGQAVCNKLTTFQAGDSETKLSAEMGSVSKFGCGILKLSKAGGIENFGQKEADQIVALGSSFGDSKFLSAVVGEALYAATEKWEAGESFMGVAKPDLGEMMNPMFNTIIKDFNEVARDSEALGDDINVLAGVVSILARDGILADISNSDSLIDKISSGTTVKDVVVALDPYTVVDGQKVPTYPKANLKNVVTELTNLGMRAIGSMLSLPANAEEIYGEFIDDVLAAVNDIKSQSLSDEAAVEALSEELKDALADSGVIEGVDATALSLYASAMLDDFASLSTVNATNIEEFFKVYAAVSSDSKTAPQSGISAYSTLADEAGEQYASPMYQGKTLEQLKNTSGAGVVANVVSELAKLDPEATDEDFQNSVQEIINRSIDAYATATGNSAKANALKEKLNTVEVTKESVSGDGLKLGASLGNAESLPTVKITLDNLLVGAEAAGLIDSNTIENEAEAIKNIFGSAVSIKDLLPSDGGSMDSLSAVAEKLGTVLNELNGMNSFGEEKTANLVTAVFQSETVSGTLGLDLATATELATRATEKSGNESVNFEETMKGVSCGADIAQKLGKEGEQITEEEIRELLVNMTPQTAGMMKAYMTAERLTGYGIPEEKSEFSALTMRNLFTEMADKQKYADQYDEQTKAILKIFDIASESAKTGSSSSNLFNNASSRGSMKMTAQEFVDLIASSDMVCNAIVATMCENEEIVEARRNPFGLEISESSTDYEVCREALLDYYNAQKTQNKALELRLNAIGAFLGISKINFDR